jgi:hypothetical protein
VAPAAATRYRSPWSVATWTPSSIWRRQPRYYVHTRFCCERQFGGWSSRPPAFCRRPLIGHSRYR